MFKNIDFIWLFKETFRCWKADKASRLAAALAYYTIFSLAPLLIIAVAIAGLVFGQEAAQGEIVNQADAMVGREGAEVVQEMVASAKSPTSGILATIIGVVTLFMGASGVFGQLEDSLNTIWGVAPSAAGNIWGMIKGKFLNFTIVLGIGFLLLVSLVLSAGISAFTKYASDVVPGVEIAVHMLNFVLSFALTTLLFAIMYRILPDVDIAWRDVWLGAAVTSLLFTIGKIAIGFYLGQSSAASAYGAAGSLVVLLLWIYYSAQILFLGAEFTQVYTSHYGSHTIPEKNAQIAAKENPELVSRTYIQT